MKQLNLVEIDTRWGFRSIELYHGDITRLDTKVDILAVSAFRNNYVPTPGTVIAALQANCNVSVADLAQSKEYDLRDAFDCWVSEIPFSDRFGRLICVEMIDDEQRRSEFMRRLPEVIQNVFVIISMLEAKGVQVKSLALPVLGAGQQQIEPEPVIAALLTSSKKFLQQSPNLAKVLFVALNEQRARQLDMAMDRVLERVAVLPKQELVKGLRDDLSQNIDRAQAITKSPANQIFSDLRRLAITENGRSFELGIAARRLVEFMVNDILPEKRRGADLMNRIDRLAELHIADWIRSYMHVLRVFGNESAHEQHRENRHPSTIDSTDMALCLFCVQRLISFWLDYKRARTKTPVSETPESPSAAAAR